MEWPSHKNIGTQMTENEVYKAKMTESQLTNMIQNTDRKGYPSSANVAN